jgi:hypothetical protein
MLRHTSTGQTSFWYLNVFGGNDRLRARHQRARLIIIDYQESIRKVLKRIVIFQMSLARLKFTPITFRPC